MQKSALPFAVLGTLLLLSCGDGGGPTGGGSVDETPPSIAAVTPVDELHFNIIFNEEVTKQSAQNERNYVLAQGDSLAQRLSRLAAISAGDTLYPASVSLQPDGKTVAFTMWQSMSGSSFKLWIDGVTDTRGNRIETPLATSFDGSDQPDITPPSIVSFSPANGSTDASVGVSAIVQFSEPLEYFFTPSITWTSPSGPVSFNTYSLDYTTLALVPYHELGNSELQTISLSGVKDQTGNVMATTQRQFTTTGVIDRMPPTVVSTIPRNLATHVGLNTSLSITFSEPVNQYKFDVALDPGFYVDETAWSADGKTVSLRPATGLSPDQQYVVTVYSGGVVDLAGNHFEGIQRVAFSTGGSIANGSISGTISGDPGTAVDDPAGAIVAILDTDDAGSVERNGHYTIPYMKDGSYYVLALKDTDGDGQWSPTYGDPIGEYGVNLENHDYEPDSVLISNATHATSISFPIYDPSALVGTVTYTGSHQPGDLPFFVGLFRKSGFNPANPTDPVAATGDWLLGGFTYGDWVLNSIQDDFPDGDYYLFAYVNVNEWTTYEPGIDPAGMYGGLASPTVIHIANGVDFRHVSIAILDPVIAMSSSNAHVAWPVSERNPDIARLFDAMKKESGQPLAARFGSKIISTRE